MRLSGKGGNMKVKCFFCNKESVRRYGMRVPVCSGHYDDFNKEQRLHYRGKLESGEREMHNNSAHLKIRL